MFLHRWKISPLEAVKLQNELKARIKILGLAEKVSLIAGTDLSYNKYSKTVFAGIVIINYPELNIIERISTRSEAEFPYIPGLLSFREIPPILKAFKRLNKKPDLVIMDGHGYAHPRRFGFASHFGLITKIPTIGCAKSKLIGEYKEPGKTKGKFAPLVHKKEKIGIVLRTKTDVKPIFISPGHLINFEDSRRWILNCTTKYRLPEPTRQAHILVNEARKRYNEG